MKGFGGMGQMGQMMKQAQMMQMNIQKATERARNHSKSPVKPATVWSKSR